MVQKKTALLREPPKNMPSLGKTTPVPQSMKEFPQCMVEGDTVQHIVIFMLLQKEGSQLGKKEEIQYGTRI